MRLQKTELLGTDVFGYFVGDEGERGYGAVAAETDVGYVLETGGEGYDVYYVAPFVFDQLLWFDDWGMEGVGRERGNGTYHPE